MNSRQTLGSGERGGQSTGLHGAVDRAGGAALGLHLDHGGTVFQMFFFPWELHSSENSPMLEEGVMGRSRSPLTCGERPMR